MDGDSARDAFFGELYYETTVDLLSDRMTKTEAAVISRLLCMEPHERYLDLGCGHGRHVRAIRHEGLGKVVGLDRSLLYLYIARKETSGDEGTQTSSEVAANRGHEPRDSGGGGPSGGRSFDLNPSGPFVCGDIRDLPFAEEAFAGAYSWYSGLFLFDEHTNREVLREASRILTGGGLLLHHGANPSRLARDPVARHVGRARGGGRVEEVASFDSKSGRERLHRRLIRADGSTLEGGWSVRHYSSRELSELFSDAGLVLEGFYDELGRPFDAASSLDMVAVARRPA